ncbi:hypothetical protein LOTGIDRAFT_231602 [Lottia gigantea]|uniref:RING-type domain-containing protein n=1 Tax=Lottia gigantea TaxID=225164 RepID=V4AUJ2_LOTGI|nr:hypothetical protein LOTGIDRAFT_231602 [Lottia gigantea]ESO97436.1 hypothetical protein LOTGIDRAFT_231602 [Lottia gigantea]
MSQPPIFSFYNSSAIQHSPTVQFPQYGVQPFPPPQHNPYANQYHYNTSTWSSYPSSPVQTSPHLQSRSQTPQLCGNINNSYTSPRRQSSPLMILSPITEPALFKNKGSVLIDENMHPRTLPSQMVSASASVSNINPNKDASTTTNYVYKSPNRSQIFLERAKKLGIVCARSESSSEDMSITNGFNRENEALEKKNKLNSLCYHDAVVIDKESTKTMDDLFSSVARKITTDVICSAVMELNAEYGISIQVDDFLKSVDNLLDNITDNNIIRDEEVIPNLEPMQLEAESNLEKLSSVTSSQTSLLNPDTPELKPLNVDIMDSMYLPFQTIPISPEYPEQNANHNNNNIHTESYMMASRNTDFMDLNSYWEEMVNVETQTVVEMVEKATITEFTKSQTVQVERHTTGVQTELPLVTAVPPKVKSKNKKLQTDPEMFRVKSSDSNYRYMKMLEKEVYSLRSQMCLIEIQRELHELQSTKVRWTEFFTPRHECNGLNEMLDARVNWLKQCHINIKTQLESGIARLDTGVGLKQLPEPNIYIPTANGNQTFVPKTVMCRPSQLVRVQQASNRESSVPENLTTQKDNLVSQLDIDSEISDDKQSLDETTTSSSSGEINPYKDYPLTHLKDYVVSERSSESDTSNEVKVQLATDHHRIKQLNNTEHEENRKELIGYDNSSVTVNIEKYTSKESEEAQSVDQTSVMASNESTVRNDIMTILLDVNPIYEPASIKYHTSTSLKASHICNDESHLGHHNVSKLNLSLSANLDVIKELTETIKEEADIDTQVLQNTRSTDQPQLSVKIEDIPLPDSDAEGLLEKNVEYVAEEENKLEEYSSSAFSDTKTRCLVKKIDHYLSESISDCPEEITTLPDVMNPEESVNGNSFEAPVEETSINIPKDNPLIQEIPPVLNKDLLKAVTTQLVNDYPNLLSNPDYLKKLADQQTLLLQSYLDQKTNPQTGAQAAGPDTSPHNMGSLLRNVVPVSATQQSNCSLNPAEKISSEFAKICSTGSSRPNSPVHLVQPSVNFISQQNMLPHSQQMMLRPLGPYEQHFPVSNSTFQQQYSVNAFQNQYSNRPAFINAQNVSGLFPIRQQQPMVPQTALSTTNQTHTGAPFSNPVAPYTTQNEMNCFSPNNIESSSKLINDGKSESTANGSDGMKDPNLPEKQTLKEQSPPLSIKSYLVQKDKVKLTKRKNPVNTGTSGEEDSQSMDTSSETLHNTSFSKPEISDKGTSEMNTLGVSQRFSSLVELNQSGYMSDCNIDSKVKKNSSLKHLQHDNSGYMSDSGFKSIPKTTAPGFQNKKVTTAALLSGANGFQNGSSKTHSIPSLFSLSLNSDNVQRFPNPTDSKENTYKQEPIKTFVQQPEVLHSRSEKKSTDTDMKSRKRNKTTSDLSRPSENKPLPMFQTNSGQDDWDLEADPYPTTFKFKTDAQKSLNFGTNASDLCTFSKQAVQSNPKGVPKTAKKTGLKSEAKINTQFLGRLLKSTESSNERKNSKAIPQALAMSASIQDIDEEEVDEWKTVPKKIKKIKPEVVLPPPPKPTGKKKRTVKEDAAFIKLIELMTARIPNTNRDDVIYIIGEIRKKKGTLKGIPLKNIIEMGTTIMSSKDNNHKITTASKVQVATHFAKDVPPRFKRIMEQTVTELSLPKSYEEGDVCVICCDELSAERTKALDCGHEFHIMCINEWVYKHERTCPTCRQIALFPEEFPTLGAG